MNVDSVLNWLSNIIKTIPDGIIQTFIIGLGMFVLRVSVRRIPKVGGKLSRFINQISAFFSKNTIEISEHTKIIKTPQYVPGQDFKANKKPRKTKSSQSIKNADLFGIVFLSIILISGIVTLFIKYINEISFILKWYGLIPLLISITILFIVTFTARVQKATLVYLVYSIPISMLTIYYGVALVNISEGMSPALSDGRLMYSAYKIFGLIVAVLQQFFTYIMIFRNILINVARKFTVPKFVKKFIYNTSFFESQVALIISIVLLSCLSYLMTSGLLMSWIQNH